MTAYSDAVAEVANDGWNSKPKEPELVRGSDAWEKKKFELLAKWEADKKAYSAAKDAEMESRKAFVAFILIPGQEGKAQQEPLNNGYYASYKQPVKTVFKKGADGKIDRHGINDALDAIEKRTDVGKLLADRLVDWKPDLSLTEYKKLPEEDKKIIDAVLEEKSDGAPTLEIKGPTNK